MGQTIYALFLIAPLLLFWTGCPAQTVEVDRERFLRWAANRALADTLLDEAEGDYQKARAIIKELKADMDTCLAISDRQGERFDQATFELERCQEEKEQQADKVKRLRVWAWISRIGVGLGAVFAVKELVDQAP